MSARFTFARLCALYLYRTRGYRRGDYYHSRVDAVIGSCMDWATGSRIAPLGRLMKSAWRRPLRHA